MIAIRGIAAVAILGVAAIAAAPRAASDTAANFTLEFRFDTARSALDNYLAFARAAEDACSGQGPRRLDLRQLERACVEDVMERLVAAMGRSDLAAIHAQRLGRPDDSSRTLAVR
jgi:hypothetical protein